MYLKNLRHIMYKYAQGSKRIKHRSYLKYKFSQYIKKPYSDRHFRALVAQEPKIITCTDGYYILPKRDKYGVEAKVAVSRLRQNRAKATALWRRLCKQLNAIDNLRYKKTLV